jgi:O-antigen/teichoic acid export membrane protein
MVEAGLTAERPERPAARLRRWAGILSAFFTTQGLVQLAGIAAGLLLVRTLPVQEFALYTLALSVVTFFTFLSDLGSTTSLVHFFHRTRREGGDFAPYLQAVLALRRWAFLAGTAAVLLAFPRAVAAKGYALGEIALVTGGVLLCVWFQIHASLRVLALRLADRYPASYRAELAGAGVRLLAVIALIVASLLHAWLAVLITAAATAATVVLARPAAPPAAMPDAALGPYRRRVLHYLLPTLPSALFFSVQGPLTVWLAATFGATRNIAEVGALSRLGLIVGIFSSLTGVVFLPRLAQIADEHVWRTRYLQFGGALLAVALTLLAAAALLPGPFLWILGASYAGLSRELLLVVGGAGLSLIGGYVVNVNLARAWTRWQTATVIVEIIVQAALIAVLPLSTTAGVLTLTLSSTATGVALQLVVAWLGFHHPARVAWRTSL